MFGCKQVLNIVGSLNAVFRIFVVIFPCNLKEAPLGMGSALTPCDRVWPQSLEAQQPPHPLLDCPSSLSPSPPLLPLNSH